MKLLLFIAITGIASLALAQPKDSTEHLSLLEFKSGQTKLKETLFRGLLHEGISAGFQYSNRTMNAGKLCDWSSELSAGLVLWNGAMGISATISPIDVGYTFRYLPQQTHLRYYVGPYARMELTWNEFLQLDAQHPYWFTQHQIGVRNWLFWSVANEKTLVLKTDLSLLSLISRPPEWRDYSTYTLNPGEIIGYMHENMKLVTLLDAVRFDARVEYQVTYGGQLPLLYFFELTYHRVNDPKSYQDIRQSLGLSIALN